MMNSSEETTTFLFSPSDSSLMKTQCPSIQFLCEHLQFAYIKINVSDGFNLTLEPLTPCAPTRPVKPAAPCDTHTEYYSISWIIYRTIVLAASYQK